MAEPGDNSGLAVALALDSGPFMAALASGQKQANATVQMSVDQAIAQFERTIPVTTKVSSAIQAAFSKASQSIMGTASAATTSGQSMAQTFATASKALNQNQLISNVESLTSVFIQMGGETARLASVTTTLIRPLALLLSTLGPVTLGVAGLVVADLALVEATVALAGAADNAEKELAKLGVGIDKNLKEQVEAGRVGTESLTIALDRMKLSIGAPFAEAWGIAKQAMAETADEIERDAPKWDTLRKVFEGIIGQSTTLYALYGILKTIVTPTKEWVDAQVKAKEVNEEYVKELNIMVKASKDANDAMIDNLKKKEAEDGKAADTNEAVWLQQQKDWAKAQEAHKKFIADMMADDATWARFAQQTMDMLDDQITEGIKKQAKLDAKKASDHEKFVMNMMGLDKEWSQEEAAASKEADERLEAGLKHYRQVQAQAHKQFVGYIVDETQTIVNSVNTLVDTATEKYLEAGRKEMAMAQRKADKEAEVSQKYLDMLLEAGVIDKAKYNERMKNIDEETKAAKRAAKERAQDELDAARRSFQLSQLLQSTQATIEAARSAVSLVPALAYLGPAAPGAAAAIAAAALAAQLAVINSQPYPSYPMGMDPDHHQVGIQHGESILTRRATMELGTNTIRALNKGMSAAQPRIVFQVGARELASSIGSSSGRPRVTGKRSRRRNRG